MAAGGEACHCSNGEDDDDAGHGGREDSCVALGLMCGGVGGAHCSDLSVLTRSVPGCDSTLCPFEPQRCHPAG